MLISTEFMAGNFVIFDDHAEYTTEPLTASHIEHHAESSIEIQAAL
jgi:hypothetical protein